MNKSELIEAIAAKANASKVATAFVVNATLEVIAETLAKGDAVAILGFGTFETHQRAARPGKNPATGEAIKIAASISPAFKPGKALKEGVAQLKKGNPFE